MRRRKWYMGLLSNSVCMLRSTSGTETEHKANFLGFTTAEIVIKLVILTDGDHYLHCIKKLGWPNQKEHRQRGLSERRADENKNDLDTDDGFLTLCVCVSRGMFFDAKAAVHSLFFATSEETDSKLSSKVQVCRLLVAFCLSSASRWSPPDAGRL